MKIAIISDHVPLAFAHSIHTVKHAQGFYQLGHDVEILLVMRFNEEKNKLKIKNIHRFYAIDKNIKVRFFRDYSTYYFQEIKYFGGYMKLTWDLISKLFPKLTVFFNPEKRISKYCKKNNFDLTYCRRASTAAYYNVINKIPTIIESHNHYDMPKELKRVIKLSESKYFKGIITIYRILKKLHAIEGVPEKKINILDCSVDLNEFDSVNYKKAELRKHLYLPLDKKILLYSGKLTDERGIDTYIEASRTLDNKKYEFCFLGGNKKEIKLWNKYIKKKRISGDFRFLGSKNYNLVKYYLKSADLLLALFSSKCRTIKWMSPLKIFEYMASKVPFIASNAFRLHEICNNNECLFYNIDDSRDLSEKIKLLIENMDLRENLIQNAYTKVKNYGYKKRCEKILELI